MRHFLALILIVILPSCLALGTDYLKCYCENLANCKYQQLQDCREGMCMKITGDIPNDNIRGCAIGDPILLLTTFHSICTNYIVTSDGNVYLSSLNNKGVENIVRNIFTSVGFKSGHLCLCNNDACNSSTIQRLSIGLFSIFILILMFSTFN